MCEPARRQGWFVGWWYRVAGFQTSFRARRLTPTGGCASQQAGWVGLSDGGIAQRVALGHTVGVPDCCASLSARNRCRFPHVISSQEAYPHRVMCEPARRLGWFVGWWYRPAGSSRTLAQARRRTLAGSQGRRVGPAHGRTGGTFAQVRMRPRGCKYQMIGEKESVFLSRWWGFGRFD